jgi:glucan 1,3-beta-glucosidase
MANDTANGGLGQLETHYKTFIVCCDTLTIVTSSSFSSQTELDFAQIAGAGLNYVRIPLPYWAIETRGDEPFLAKTSWTYVTLVRTLADQGC